ncbi:hypothetical protein FOPE_00004 [Fonsecaea pedrosoi]|nr:hypothetical protein FOPE_00004 [Fonsecaea pedrosoi]
MSQSGTPGRGPPPSDRRVTRNQAQQQHTQQAQQSSSQQGQSTDLVSDINRLQLETGGSNIQTNQEVINFLLPVSNPVAITRLSNLFDTIIDRVNTTQAVINTVIASLESEPRFSALIQANPNLEQQYQNVQVIVRRHRDHRVLANSARENTRQELGDDFFNVYLQHLPTSKPQWDALRKLFGFARKEGIDAIDALRMAYFETLFRLKHPKQGGTKLRSITMTDVIHMIKFVEERSGRSRTITGRDLPSSLVPNQTDIWIDINQIPWFDRAPPPEVNPPASRAGTPLPPPSAVKAIPWVETDPATVRKRKREARKSVSPVQKKIPKPTKPHPSDSSNLTGDPDDDPFTGTGTNRPNIVVQRRIDPATGQRQTREIVDPSGTPMRSLARLSQGWQRNQLVAVPIAPSSPPRFSSWYHWNNLSTLETDLLDIHYQYSLWLNQRRPEPPDPMGSRSIQMAEPEELQDALMSLRRRCQFHQAPGVNPYTDPANEQFFFMLGLVQWLSGILVAESLRDRSWLNVARSLLQGLRQSFPTTDFTDLYLSTNNAIRADTFTNDNWLLDDTGRYQGWANDEIVTSMIEYYARDHPGTEIVSPAAFSSWQRRFYQEEDSTAVAPAILLANDLYLFPMNINNNHWVLGFIDNGVHEVGILDSMGLYQDPAVLRHVLFENGINPDTYTNATMGSGPRQTNTADCGFYTIANARAMIESRSPAVPQDTGTLRLSILGDLVRAVRGYNPSLESLRIAHRDSPAARRRQLEDNLARAIAAYPDRFKKPKGNWLAALKENKSMVIDLTEADKIFKLALKNAPKVKQVQASDTTTLRSVRDLTEQQEVYDITRLQMTSIEEMDSDSELSELSQSDLNKLMNEVAARSKKDLQDGKGGKDRKGGK